MKGVNESNAKLVERGNRQRARNILQYEAGFSLYKANCKQPKYCDRFTRWLSSFISHQIQCNMVCMGHLLLFESLTVQVHLLSICIWLVDIGKYWVTFILFAHSSLPFNFQRQFNVEKPSQIQSSSFKSHRQGRNNFCNVCNKTMMICDVLLSILSFFIRK